MHPDTTRHLRKSSTRWAAACSQKPPRKPYTKPGITDAHWAEHARQRVANTQAQPSLFAAEPDTYAQSNFQPQLLTTADV